MEMEKLSKLTNLIKGLGTYYGKEVRKDIIEPFVELFEKFGYEHSLKRLAEWKANKSFFPTAPGMFAEDIEQKLQDTELMIVKSVFGYLSNEGVVPRSSSKEVVYARDRDPYMWKLKQVTECCTQSIDQMDKWSYNRILDQHKQILLKRKETGGRHILYNMTARGFKNGQWHVIPDNIVNSVDGWEKTEFLDKPQTVDYTPAVINQLIGEFDYTKYISHVVRFEHRIGVNQKKEVFTGMAAFTALDSQVGQEV